MTEEQWLPRNKADLMSAIGREWAALMDVVAKLDPTRMTTPDSGGWSPKDNLAHLMEWMKILMGYHMDKHPAHEVMGVSPDITAGWDFEIMNKLLLERNRPRSTPEILNELRDVYHELKAKLMATPFEDLMKPRHADDPEKRPLMNWVLGDTLEHFAEHRETIQKALK